MSTQATLTAEMESLKKDLIARYDEKGMRSTGAWANSLEVVVKEEPNKITGQITGLKYSEQLEYGRSAGKQPPSAVIEQWIKDKGIASRIEGNISISSLAYLIARKIGREGWKREEEGGVDLISEVVTAERMQSIINKVGDVYIVNVVSDIQSIVNNLSNDNI